MQKEEEEDCGGGLSFFRESGQGRVRRLGSSGEEGRVGGGGRGTLMKFSCQRGKQDGKEKSKHSDFFQKYFFLPEIVLQSYVFHEK